MDFLSMNWPNEILLLHAAGWKLPRYLRCMCTIADQKFLSSNWIEEQNSLVCESYGNGQFPYITKETLDVIYKSQHTILS